MISDRHRRDSQRPTYSSAVTDPVHAAETCVSSGPSAEAFSGGAAGWAELQADRTLTLHGELDLAARDSLVRATNLFALRCISEQHEIEAWGTSSADVASVEDAIIDAAELRFIDASSLGVLITLHATLDEAGIPLRIQNPCTAMRRLSEILDLNATLGLEAPARTQSGQPLSGSTSLAGRLADLMARAQKARPANAQRHGALTASR